VPLITYFPDDQYANRGGSSANNRESTTTRTGRSRYGDGQVLSVPAVRKDGARISVEFIIVPFADRSDR
jgi:hypothetical protein